MAVFHTPNPKAMDVKDSGSLSLTPNASHCFGTSFKCIGTYSGTKLQWNKLDNWL